jgi:hypothetical protein
MTTNTKIPDAKAIHAIELIPKILVSFDKIIVVIFLRCDIIVYLCVAIIIISNTSVITQFFSSVNYNSMLSFLFVAEHFNAYNFLKPASAALTPARIPIFSYP